MPEVPTGHPAGGKRLPIVAPGDIVFGRRGMCFVIAFRSEQSLVVVTAWRE